MTDILNQIDATLADVQSCACGCGKSISEKGPSGDFYDEVCQARWTRRQAGVRLTFPARCPACSRWMEVEGRYCEPCAIALSGPIVGDFGIVQPPAVPRPNFTLADMEEASAAVRARREVPDSMVEQASRAIEAAAERAGFETFTFNNSGGTFTPHPTIRITTLDGEEIFSGPVEPWPRSTTAPERVTVTYTPADVAPPVDAALEPAADIPWWRRMLGGGIR